MFSGCLVSFVFWFNLLLLSFFLLLVQHAQQCFHALGRTPVFDMLGFQQFPDSGAFCAGFAHVAVLPLPELLQTLVREIHDAAGFDEVGEQAVGFLTSSKNDGTADLGGQVGIQQVNRVLEDLHLFSCLVAVWTRLTYYTTMFSILNCSFLVDGNQHFSKHFP